VNAEAEAAEPGFTIYDLHTADSPRRPQELPRLVAAALRIVWAAGPREAATATVLQIVGGLGTGVMVLLRKRVLDGIVAADRSGAGVGDFLPSSRGRWSPSSGRTARARRGWRSCSARSISRPRAACCGRGGHR
jgi:hypothetical protein